MPTSSTTTGRAVRAYVRQHHHLKPHYCYSGWLLALADTCVDLGTPWKPCIARVRLDRVPYTLPVSSQKSTPSCLFPLHAAMHGNLDACAPLSRSGSPGHTCPLLARALGFVWSLPRIMDT